MENSMNKAYAHFKLCTIVSCIMKHPNILLYPTQEVDLSSLACESICSYFDFQISSGGVTVLVFKYPLFYLIMASKWQVWSILMQRRHKDFRCGMTDQLWYHMAMLYRMQGKYSIY